MDDRSHEKIRAEVSEWLHEHEDEERASEKVRRYRALLRTNVMLESKLGKLKQLYEKKNAQYEAMRAAADLEKDLSDLNLDSFELGTSITTTPFDDDRSCGGFADWADKMRKLPSTREKQQLFVRLASKCAEVLACVREHATTGIVGEDVMSSVLEIVAQENPNVLFVAPATVRSMLVANRKKIIYEMLNDLNASEYGGCVFVLCNERGAGYPNHWSLLLHTRNPSSEGVYHYDASAGRNLELARKFSSMISSYYSAPRFYEVRCPQQTAEDESGFHVIETMSKVLPMLETGKIAVQGADVSLENISMLKVFPMKCRVLVMKLYTRRKLQLLQTFFSSIPS